VAAILIIFSRINRPNLVQFKRVACLVSRIGRTEPKGVPFLAYLRILQTPWRQTPWESVLLFSIAP